MKIKTIAVAMLIALMSSCGGGDTAKTTETESSVQNKVEKAAKQEVGHAAKQNETVANNGASESESIGIGPISSVELGEINEELVETGKEIYKANCTACHKIGKRSVGPALKGVTERRSPEWIMNMILNPTEMVEKDPTAKALLAEYLAPMADQSLSEDEARAILEFFRTKN